MPFEKSGEHGARSWDEGRWPAAWVPPPRPEPSAPAPRERRPLRWPAVVGTSIAVLVVAAIGAAFIRLPYDTLAPGTARPVNDLVAVEGHPVHPPEGEILFATVSSRQGINPYEAIVGWLDPAVDVVREEVVRGQLPPEEFRRLNVEAMADSKTMAQILVLRELGFTDLGAGARVIDVDGSLPAAKVLQQGDVIVAIDGATVSTADDAVAGIRARRPGDVLRLRLVRGDEPPVERSVTLAASDSGGPLLGVRLTTRIKLPFDIAIDSGNVVGPSAGLAYALELLDLLTPGELTGGVRVAATGELGRDGAVRPVGGVAQKAVAVQRAGAKLFLVPKENEAEARAGVGSRLRVEGVSTFADALKVLGTLQGSNALALPGRQRPAA